MEKMTSHELLSEMHNILSSQDQCMIVDDYVYYPNWGLCIRVCEDDSNAHIFTLNFCLECPSWDRKIYERSVGIGNEKIEMALSSFSFGLMNGIRSMMEKENVIEQLETEFEGNNHRWTVYQSDVIGTYDSLENLDMSYYWNSLREDILSHLDNQKLCYIKIFAGKSGSEVTGECSINNIICEELSQKVAEYASTWSNKNFGSQKQFIFLVQDEDTYIS